MSRATNQNLEDNDWDDDFSIVICRFLDGKLSGQEFAEFQKRLRIDSAAREQFAMISYQQNAIRENNPQSSISDTRLELITTAKRLGASDHAGSGIYSTVCKPVIAVVTHSPIVSVAVGIICLLTIGWAAIGIPRQGTQAEVAVARVSSIVGSDIYQQMEKRPGSSLFSGDIVRFGSGAVEIEFPDRATLVLTGPAKLRVDSAKRASLLFGKLSAKVTELGKGFIIESPGAEVIDLGTEFSMVVSDEGTTDVKVISGLVDIAPRRQLAEKTRLATGETQRVSTDGVVDSAYHSKLAFAGIVKSLQRPRLRIVCNKDAFLMNGDWADKSMQNAAPLPSGQVFTSNDDLLVKYDIVLTKFNRIAVVGFDLSKVSREQLLGARLSLSVATNDLATRMDHGNHADDPERDWKFVVEGVWDRGQEEWTEESITWNNSPGIDPASVSGALLGQGAPMLIGEFNIVGSGRAGDKVVINGKQLVDFLKLDDDGRVTLLIRRLTGTIQEEKNDITVHGFASRENEDLDPPTLELWMSDQ